MKSKKGKYLVCCAVLILGLSCCTKDTGTVDRAVKNQNSVQEILKEEGKKQESVQESAENKKENDSQNVQQADGEKDPAEGSKEAGGNNTSQAATGAIDVDLTTLSSTMVYTQVYDMVTAPENYLGKTVKMKGIFSSFHDENTGNDYFACIIQDATACCAQGIEFVLTDQYAYPEDYPEEMEEITVTGKFDTYMEEGNQYCTLRNAELVK